MSRRNSSLSHGSRFNFCMLFLTLFTLLLISAAYAEVELNTTFGTDGLVSTDFGGNESIYSLVLDSDGNIVAGGHADGDFVLARYREASSSSNGGCNTTAFSAAMILLALPLALLFRKKAK